MKKNKKTNKKDKPDLTLQKQSHPFNPFQIDSYRRYKKQAKKQNQHFVSVSMQMPVFSQYTHLNLKKNHSRYNRINRTITQNKNLKPASNISLNLKENLKNNPSHQESKTKNPIINPHSILLMNKKNLFRSASSTSNDHKQSPQTQNSRQEKWNKEIQKYMSIKEQLSGFNVSEQKFPLMKLNRCNQIKRKLLFGSNMSENKPSFIYELETSDPQQLNVSKAKIALPNVSKSISKSMNQRLIAKNVKAKKTRTKLQQRQESIQRRNQNNNQNQNEEDEQLQNIRQSLPKATNQDQKILVNFISQYFKQKLKSSRKKRYNYERTWTQITTPLHINIKHLKNKPC